MNPKNILRKLQISVMAFTLLAIAYLLAVTYLTNWFLSINPFFQ